ncbi:MAG: hypothetical protein M3O71_26005 [Bacteroidota bacterium]|nr:hypothetical protein [Bacteroidota bacterium]
MKVFFSVLLIAISTISWQTKRSQFYAPLTNADRKKYVLSVDQQKITKPETTKSKVYLNEMFSTIVVKLSNNSSDSLKYVTMSCSWMDNFITNNLKFAIGVCDCDSNFPDVKIIPPHKTAFFTIRILYKKRLATRDNHFKIGMLIVKDLKENQPIDFISEYFSQKKYMANMIWSNPVKIPQY